MRALRRENAAKSLLGGLVLLAGFLVAAACSHDKPAEPTNNFANYGGANYGPTPYGANDAGATPPPVTAGVDAAAPDLNNLVTGALAQGAALLGAMSGSDPVDNGIKSIAQQQAPGMKPEGAVIKTTLAPGAHGEGTVTLRPGKCYTIIGFGNLGVQQLAHSPGAARATSAPASFRGRHQRPDCYHRRQRAVHSQPQSGCDAPQSRH